MRLVKNSLRLLALIVIFAFFLIPFYWLIAMSFMTNQDILSYPPKFLFHPTLSNYLVLFTGRMLTPEGYVNISYLSYFWHSVVISCGSVLVSLIVGIPAAYAFSRYRFAGRENLAFTILSVTFAPPLLVIIPLSLLFHDLGLYDTYTGLFLVYQLITLPLIVWIVRSYFDEIPIEVEQAMRLDGYNWWQTFRRIALPLARPGIASASLLAFIYAWNSFAFALVLGSSDVQPVTVAGLAFVTASGISYGNIAAAMVFSIVPTLILAIVVQRYLVRGLSLGAIKG
jgi:multiple sugar transport system permease protein